MMWPVWSVATAAKTTDIVDSTEAYRLVPPSSGNMSYEVQCYKTEAALIVELGKVVMKYKLQFL